MFWILGMEEVAVALGKATNNTWVQGMAHQLDHAPWAGFHCLDLVFPMFVFAAGVSLVFSLSRAVENGGRTAAVRKAGIRALNLGEVKVLDADGKILR